MRKKLMAVTLTLLCTQAFAGWTATPYVSGADGTFYWDSQSIAYNGDSLKIWIADDFGEAQTSKFNPGVKYFSHKELLELNCAKSQSKVIEYVEYSDHFAAGKVVVRNQNSGNWYRIEPDTLSFHVMQTFCKQPKSGQ
jgi:hypothetical protein